MKKTSKLLVFVFIAMMNVALFAQVSHTVDFETPDTGQGWSWTTFEGSPTLTEMANPVSGGLNTSATVMEFVANPTDQPWTGCWTMDDGEFTFDVTNSTVTMLVYKDVISTVKMKFEGASAPVEVDAINTVTGAWELLTYDFSGVIGDTYDKLIVFPDFNFSRTVVTTSYFDNIQVPDGVVPDPDPEPTDAPPVPTHAEVDVIPIYTEVYTDLTGTDFNPNWGQSTSVTVDYMAAGNNTLQYTYLNYQGTQYTNQDVTAYEYLHVDFWTPSSTFLDFYLISPGLETFYSLPITLDTWVSVDIPLSHYVPPVNLSDVFQFKVVGDGTVYFDNWYFWKTPTAAGEDATLSDLKVNGVTVDGFAPTTFSYDYAVEYGSPVPTVTATTTDPNATHVVNDAASLPGATTVDVTADDEIHTETYTVNFNVIPGSGAPVPAHDETANEVISIYSDSYTDITGVTLNPNWGQTTQFSEEVLDGNNTLLYGSLNYQGTDWAGNPQDVSARDYLHVDYWTGDSSDLGIYLISGAWPSSVEYEYVFTILNEQWVSVDIPLSYFSDNGVDLADVTQFKVEGNGDVWFDNYYFWKESTALDAPANVTITASVLGATISWDAVIGANSYKVYSSSDPYAAPETWTLEEEGIAGTSWNHSVPGDMKYYYVVASTDAP